MSVSDFAAAADGSPVRRIAIEGGGLTAAFMTFGATLLDLRLAGHDAPLVLGFEQFTGYLATPAYLGATVGRFANRIGKGRFSIDGEVFETDRNDRGNTLHGGAEGASRRVWRLDEAGADFVRFGLVDPDGHMGFPGTVEVSATYRLGLPATLSVAVEARADLATPVGFAHHSYFNLDDGGSGTIRAHRIMIPAEAYLPVDEALIPTGAVRPVAGTAFDFRIPRAISPGGGLASYDHNFCLAAARGSLRQAAWLQGAVSGIEMEVWTTEPGLQFYTGQGLAPEAAGIGGRRYGVNAGLCLEPQAWPDAPNHAHFPQAILRPGETYRQETQYRFRLPS